MRTALRGRGAGKRLLKSHHSCPTFLIVNQCSCTQPQCQLSFSSAAGQAGKASPRQPVELTALSSSFTCTGARHGQASVSGPAAAHTAVCDRAVRACRLQMKASASSGFCLSARTSGESKLGQLRPHTSSALLSTCTMSLRYRRSHLY